MSVLRPLPCFAFIAACALSAPAAGQATFRGDTATLANTSSLSPWGRSYLGINVGRPRTSTVCGASSFLCDGTDRPTQIYAGTMLGSFWGAEVTYLNTGRMLHDASEGRSQGLNVSLFGRARLGSSLGVFGKLGTVYSRSEFSTIGAGPAGLTNDQGFGLAFGGGVSYDFTPRLSARLEWDSRDMRFSATPVRSTSLGLQYRY